MFRKRSRGEDPANDGLGESIETSEEPVEIQSDSVEYEDDDGYYDDEDEEEYEPRQRDPLVGWMTLVSLMLVIVAIAATASMVFFLLGMRGAPRTAVERAISQSEAVVKSEPTADNYLQLAYSYLAAGRYADASAQVKLARRVKDTARCDLVDGDILRAQEKHAQAIAVYEKAAKRNAKEIDKEQKALAKRGIVSPVSRDTYVSIMIGEGESYAALGRDADALKAFKEAVKYDSTNAFALVRVGDMSGELGKAKEAKTAYDEALRFIPDYEPAKTGLARLSTAGAKE